MNLKMRKSLEIKEGILRFMGRNAASQNLTIAALGVNPLANAWAFVRLNREEIDRQIQDNETALNMARL